jgi:hypothetical protein
MIPNEYTSLAFTILLVCSTSAPHHRLTSMHVILSPTVIYSPSILNRAQSVAQRAQQHNECIKKGGAGYIDVQNMWHKWRRNKCRDRYMRQIYDRYFCHIIC